MLEIELPFWIDRSDCKVDIDDRRISVKVRGEMSLTRTYWRDGAQESKKAYAGPVDVSNCVWSLDDEIAGNGEKIKVRVYVNALKLVTSRSTNAREENVEGREGREGLTACTTSRSFTIPPHFSR